MKHEQVIAVGSPDELIENEAQSRDLILLPRGGHFRFTAKGDEGDETLKKVLKNASRPIVVVPPTGASGTDRHRVRRQPPGRPCPVGLPGNRVARDGPGPRRCRCEPLRGGRQVERPGTTSSTTTSRRIACVGAFRPAGPTDPGQGRLPGGRPARDGSLRPAGAGEFFVGSVTRTAMSQCSVPLFLYH